MLEVINYNNYGSVLLLIDRCKHIADGSQILRFIGTINFINLTFTCFPPNTKVHIIMARIKILTLTLIEISFTLYFRISNDGANMFESLSSSFLNFEMRVSQNFNQSRYNIRKTR